MSRKGVSIMNTKGTKRTRLVTARGSRTQTDIAQAIGVKQQTYSHWEQGRSTPCIEKMILLEHILKVPKEVLFYDVFNSVNEYICEQLTGTGF